MSYMMYSMLDEGILVFKKSKRKLREINSILKKYQDHITDSTMEEHLILFIKTVTVLEELSDLLITEFKNDLPF